MTVTFVGGTLTQISETLVNPYGGQQIQVAGDYYINDVYVFGGAGTSDILITSSLNQFFRLEDVGETLLLDGFETFLMDAGDDILILSSTTNLLGDLTLSGGNGNDILWSNAGDDAILGEAGNDVLHGGPGNDAIDGGEDDDEIVGGQGDDVIDGGPGNDTAIYNGVFASYVVTDNSGTLTVAGASGTDTVSNVEILQFANGTYSNGIFTPYAAAVPAMGVLGLLLTVSLLALCGAWTLRRRALPQ